MYKDVQEFHIDMEMGKHICGKENIVAQATLKRHNLHLTNSATITHVVCQTPATYSERVRLLMQGQGHTTRLRPRPQGPSSGVPRISFWGYV